MFSPEIIFLFKLPTFVYFGYNSVTLVGEKIKTLGIQKALIVTDQGVLQAGLVERVRKSLQDSGLNCEMYFDVPEDPSDLDVNMAFDFFKQHKADGIVAVGGGSVMGVAKALALLATNGGNILDYVGEEKFRVPPQPVVCIPTTAGSGSEVSDAFVLTNSNTGSKVSIRGAQCYPRIAILDPLLLETLPPRQFIISALDALSHAIEALWTNRANPITDSIAYEAFRIMWHYLPRAAYSSDLYAKGQQLIACTMANMACGNARLGLVHAMSNPLSAYRLPHGLANGILLPYVAEYNLPVCVEKLARLANIAGLASRSLEGWDRAKLCIEGLRKFLDILEVPDRIPEDQVPRSEVTKMVNMAIERPGARVNLRKANAEDMRRIYEKAYEGWR